MPKHYWFGDSWICGDELELVVPMDERGNYTFPNLIGQQFDAETVNLGVSGSSIDAIPFWFKDIVDVVRPEDTVFFALTAPHRTTLFDAQGLPKHILPGSAYNQVHPYLHHWFKYFDSEPQRAFNYDRTVNLLYLWCKKLNIRCWFFNLFTTGPESIFDLTPECVWLLPRDHCVSEFIMPVNGDSQGFVVSNDSPFLTDYQWQTQKECLDKYVRPGYCHPNLSGHRLIADQLVQKLQEKLTFSSE